MSAFKVLTLLFCSSHAFSADKVVLQLKWEHEFQFAGYYAALWQGYYEREGLAVEIRSWARPDGQVVSPLEELISGRAQFAIGGTDIMVNKGRGYDLVVVAGNAHNSTDSLGLALVKSAPRLTRPLSTCFRKMSAISCCTWLTLASSGGCLFASPCGLMVYGWLFTVSNSALSTASRLVQIAPFLGTSLQITRLCTAALACPSATSRLR